MGTPAPGVPGWPQPTRRAQAWGRAHRAEAQSCSSRSSFLTRGLASPARWAQCLPAHCTDQTLLNRQAEGRGSFSLVRARRGAWPSEQEEDGGPRWAEAELLRRESGVCGSEVVALKSAPPWGPRVSESCGLLPRGPRPALGLLVCVAAAGRGGGQRHSCSPRASGDWGEPASPRPGPLPGSHLRWEQEWGLGPLDRAPLPRRLERSPPGFSVEVLSFPAWA